MDKRSITKSSNKSVKGRNRIEGERGERKEEREKRREIRMERGKKLIKNGFRAIYSEKYMTIIMLM